jgi:hypothetical protein
MSFVYILTADGWVRKGAPSLPTQVGLGYGNGPYGNTSYGG